jgi:ferric-dicitrate binding protein FerR (iron transport regulator)
MYGWFSALLGALLSLGGAGITSDNIVGTAHLAGPVFVNGHRVSVNALLTDGDRIETGAGGVMVLNLSSTDRLILGERSSINVRSSEHGVTAEMNIGRMQVNTTHERLKEVVLTDEGISIDAVPGQPHEYLVTRLANASYVMARQGSLRLTDEGYGDSEVVPEGMVGTARTELTHLEPPPPSLPPLPSPQGAKPVSTASGHAGSITAINPKGAVVRDATKQTEEATKGKDLNFRDLVSTEATGRMRMVLLDGSILNLGSQSQMHINENDPKTRKTEVELVAGRVRAQVRKISNPNGEWEVRTSTAVCGVLGTDFFVETDGTKTRLVVFEGKVRFTPLSKGLIAAGTSAVTLIAGQTSTAVAGAVASPVAAGATASTAAAASTVVTGQAATAAGQVAVQAASRLGVVSATAAPTAAASAVLGATAAGDTGNAPGNNIIIGSSGTVTVVVSCSNPAGCS